MLCGWMADFPSVAGAGVMIEGTTSPPILELMDLAEENTREYAPQLTIARSTNSFGAQALFWSLVLWRCLD